MKSHIYTISAFLLFLFACKENPKNEISETKDKYNKAKKEDVNLNISLLLDLSDRIDTTKYHNEALEFYLRDVGYIESIANSFVEHLKVKRMRAMDDKIAVFFDPVPQNPKIDKISESLKFHVSRNNASLDLFEDIRDTYKSKSREIYEQALSDNKYVGSDTWNFFKNKVKSFCIEENSSNLLIILTDGYLYHMNNLRKEGNLSTYLTPQFIRTNELNDSNWKERFENDEYGFIPASDNLENLQVLVLGINPNNGNVYEDDVIKAYWQKWFEEMGVGYYEIRNAELPSDMDKIVKNFILNK